MKHWFGILLMITIIIGFSFCADASDEISVVKLRIEVEDDGEEAEIEAESTNSRYEVVSTELYHEFFSPATGPGIETSREKREEAEAQNAVCEIELCAKENYQFGRMQQQDIKIDGIDGLCTKAVRKDDGKTLLLTITLTGLNQYVGSLEAAYFEDGIATWEPAVNASAYSLLLYRNDRKVCLPHETGGTAFDFTPLLTEPGQYFYKIIPLSPDGGKGRAAESDLLRVTDASAAKYRLIHSARAPAWQQDEKGWRYRSGDGTYIQDNWIQEQNEWYYFDGGGYMAADDWRFWKGRWYYFAQDGRLSLNPSEASDF